MVLNMRIVILFKMAISNNLSGVQLLKQLGLTVLYNPNPLHYDHAEFKSIKMKLKKPVAIAMVAATLLTLCSSFESAKMKHHLPIAKRCTSYPALATVRVKTPEVTLPPITQTTEDLLLGKMTDEETASFQLMLMQYGSIANAERVMQKKSDHRLK
jgi:hypothetical protein